MTFTDALSGVQGQIGQIQSLFNAPPPAGGGPGGGDFESVMQQISAISSGLGGGQAIPSGAADLSGSYGWPMEEGALTPAELKALGPTTTVGAPATATATGTPLSGASSSVDGTSPGTLDGAYGYTSASADGAGTSDQSWGSSIVDDARKYLGVPYIWGGTDPATGLDCSGLVQDVFKDLGVDLPRTADEQSSAGTAVPSLADAQPGDLVFFAGSDGTPTDPGHVGIYIGNGQMIDAPYAGTDVRVDPVSAAGTPVAIRRVSPPTAPGAVALTGATSGEAQPGTPVEASSSPDLAIGSPDLAMASASPVSAMAGSYSGDFTRAASNYGVPANLLAAVAETESGFNPSAVSSAGAEGLMQLMPTTASSMGVDPFDAGQAVQGAAQLLSAYHQQFGSWSLALAAYNAGPNAVSEYQGVPPYAQTQDYVQKVLSLAGMEGQ